ncbi:hypothetical protein [Pelagibacterium lacus]|uniref:hypothetical protein n=1 Tax=Pelagibacterium lacus TaxID=2282655 RepID=UPI0013145FA7|nr:hypothetical protein [Pelagibacterium lacus]
MKGKMYKLTGTGRFGKAPQPKGPRYAAPLPWRSKDAIADHLPKGDALPLPLPDKLKGK